MIVRAQPTANNVPGTTAAGGSADFQWDDGTGENSIGDDGSTFGWANQFTNSTGSDIVLDEIEIAFGALGGSNNVNLGDAVDGVIWIDTAATGNIVNATLARRWPLAGGVHANDGTTFMLHTIPGGGVIIPAGAEFYVGLGDIQTQNDGVSRFPAALDETTPQLKSWVFEGLPEFDPVNLAAQNPDLIDNFGFPGNWMIRANYSDLTSRPARAWGEDYQSGRVADFLLNEPETVFEGGATGASRYMGAGDFGPEGTFEFMYVLNSGHLPALSTLSTIDGSLTRIGLASLNPGEDWSGMAWDSTSGTMYASAANCGLSSTLYTINLATGASTPVGPMVNAPCAVALAAAPDGTLYAFDIVTDDFGSVDKVTGLYTPIGSIGFDCDFGQGLDFNDKTGTLYMTAIDVYAPDLRQQLRIVDLATGATSLVGTIGSIVPGLAKFGMLGIDPGDTVPTADPLLVTGEDARTNRYLRFSAPTTTASSATASREVHHSGAGRLVTGTSEHLGAVVDGGIAGGGPFVGIHPVDPTNGTSYGPEVVLNGNTFTLDGSPTRLWFEIQLGGWGAELVQSWQVKVDSASFCNGEGDCLGLAATACINDTDCVAAHGPGSRCGYGGPGLCGATCQDLANPDFLALDISNTADSTLAFYSFVVSASYPLDDGRTWYGGNLVLDVPPGAKGDFTIEVLQSATDTFFKDPSYSVIPIVTFQTAIVENAGPDRFMGVHPVQPTNGTSYGPNVVLNGNTFTLDGSPARLWFEVQLGGWGGLLKTWQAKLDLTSLDNGSGSPLIRPTVGCSGDGDCESAFGPGSTCYAGVCKTAFMDESHPDLPASQICAVGEANAAFGCTVVNDPLEQDDGRTWYGGNLVLDVPAGAIGDFTLEVVQTSTFMKGPSNADIPIDVYPTAVVDTPNEEVIRVRVFALDGFESPSPDVLYVGPPFAAPEEDSSLLGQTFAAAPLQCAPYAHVWSDVGLISAFGAEIMPNSIYAVQRAWNKCPNLESDESCWSKALTIGTGKYGDIWPLFDGNTAGAPQPDFNDIAASVQKFLASPGAPIKAVAQLQPNIVFPERAIDFRDISADVAAFVGTSYPSANFGPCTCPSSVICRMTACTNDLQCGTGLCVNCFCGDECGRCTP